MTSDRCGRRIGQDSRRGLDQRGSGTMLNVAIIVVLLTIAAAIAVFAGYSVARHRAQNAADLAALAAAKAEGASGDGTYATVTVGGPSAAVCSTARQMSIRNGATVTSCEVIGSPLDFVVTVRVRVPVAHHPPGLPDQVTAEANAAPVR